MKTKFFFILFFAIFSSCKNEADIDNYIINDENNYWVYYSTSQTGYIYFKFHKDKTYDKYIRDLQGNFKRFNKDGDLIDSDRKWSVSNDSIFSWGAHKYDLVNCNEKVLVLSYEDRVTKLPKNIFLIKEERGEFRKSPYFFEQKRKNNPAKYRSL
ncbi:hypothetical protein [Flavobacterium sp. '19STA2R22 D10 B1']|uniref:hypothetical protein n=1 Tax=Flavobacterium aerium TaxID=3037261 RepID=UPI00278BE2AD|nr:hypothetical protein [Flavobacterium sp. '19STA2R22 D10 B1']